jgi:glycosyltransferase involved in cell wall biosynthesis
MITDLIMWVKDGTSTLPYVFDQINRVIPKDVIGQRIVVDDGSKDLSKALADFWGWKVILNKGKGISDGANTALSYVSSEYFCSFEQDVVLSKDWWSEVSSLIAKGCTVACGVRLPDKPVALHKIEEYAHEKYEAQSKKDPRFSYGKTIDNTIYKTSIVKQLGGFPNINSNVGVDAALSKKIFEAGYSWVVNYNLKSVHLRNGILGELRHNFWYGKEAGSFVGDGKRLLFSPIRAIEISIKKRCLTVLFLYPLLKLVKFIGVISK